MLDALLVFAPGPVKTLVDKGLWRGTVMLLALLVGLPLVLALLAAFWLAQLKKIDHPVAAGLRNWYLETINEGFSIEELSARSHARLDYLQLFEFEMQPGKPSARRELQISVQARQTMAIDFKRIELVSDRPDCSVTEEPIELVTVKLGDQLLKSLPAEQKETVRVHNAWWDEHGKAFDADELVGPLEFRLTPEAARLACGKVWIEGQVRVFKTLAPKARP